MRFPEWLTARPMPHAVLLLGPPGSGKRTLARWMAAAALCTAQQRPCGVCRACALTLRDAHPDVRVFAGTGASGAIRVEQIRELRQDAQRPPLEADVKIFLLPQADAMTEQAQNALLKILEEPPAYVRFVLTAPTRDRLLPTVVSRVQTFSLPALSVEDCAWLLLRQNPDADPANVRALSERFGGDIGKAREALAGENADAGREAAQELLTAALRPDENPLLAQITALGRDRARFAAAMEQAQLILRDACALRAGAHTAVSGAEETAACLSHGLPQSGLMAMGQVCREAADLSARNVNMTLLVTATAARLRTAAGK